MLEQKQQIYGFDNFRLDVSNRELLCDGQPVALPAKAFDMLVVLIENGGRLVGKDELFSRVWPDQIVEESNLAVHVSAIRKTLGDKKDNPRYLVTVPGHGYRFTGKLLSLDEEEEEVVIERHSISRLTVESKNEDSVIKNISTQNGGYLTTSEATASMGPRSVGRRTLLLASLGIIVISLGLLFVLKRSRSPDKASAAPIKSIAVLPFKPLVAASGDESLELGMAETLITRLSSLRELKVPPTSAVRKYNGLEQDAIAAGRELQVESVLDGNIQKVGDRLRVTVRLVRVADGQSLWTESFDENFTSIFAVQDRVSERVAAALAVRLTGEQRGTLVKRYTNNPQAYELYLKGNYFSGGGITEAGVSKSIEYYQQAINLDSGYAPAYAGLANAYMSLGNVWGFLPPRETFPKAESAVMKALELDETLADAHAALGSYKMSYEWDWSGAERELKRAIELDPDNVRAHQEFGSYLQRVKRFDEAIAERNRARELDPLSPTATANVGYPYYYTRQYEIAIEHYQHALELDPQFSWSHLWIGQAFVQMGRYQEALTEITKAISLSGGNTRAIATLGHAYAAAGRTAEARKVIDELKQSSKRRYVSAYFIAVIYSGLGDRDQAFTWLEKAYQERHPYMTLIGVEPVFDPVRSDPRFADLVRRVGLRS